MFRYSDLIINDLLVVNHTVSRYSDLIINDRLVMYHTVTRYSEFIINDLLVMNHTPVIVIALLRFYGCKAHKAACFAIVVLWICILDSVFFVDVKLTRYIVVVFFRLFHYYLFYSRSPQD